MVARYREEDSPQTDITFPHVNDEDGWFYYCFSRTKENQENPTELHCRKPLLSHLIQLDYVLCNNMLILDCYKHTS